MNKVFILIIILFMFSCKKKHLNKVHPEMQGFWKHWNSQNEWRGILIDEHGAGKESTVKDGVNTVGDVHRAWYIKDDYLMWSWKRTIKSNWYKIDKYPTTSDSQFIDGLDTIMKGNVYIILDGKYFVDRGKHL